MHGGEFILEFVKCYIGFCTQGALKWIRKKKKTYVSKCPSFRVLASFQWLLKLSNLRKLKRRTTDGPNTQLNCLSQQRVNDGHMVIYCRILQCQMEM
jgi:hypothetical protein